MEFGEIMLLDRGDSSTISSSTLAPLLSLLLASLQVLRTSIPLSPSPLLLAGTRSSTRA